MFIWHIHTHKEKGGNTHILKLEDTTIENDVHTHVKGGGESAFTIERALLLLRSTFIRIRGGGMLLLLLIGTFTHTKFNMKRESGQPFYC